MSEGDGADAALAPVRCPRCQGTLAERSRTAVIVRHKQRPPVVHWGGGVVTLLCHHLDRRRGRACGTRVDVAVPHTLPLAPFVRR